MQRRNFLIGAAGTAIGGSALVGSGAFTSVQADRSVSVEVAGDAKAFLAIEPEQEGTSTTPNADEYVDASGDTVSLDITGDDDSSTDIGSGLNDEATTVIDDILRITNQGTQGVYVGYTHPASPNGNFALYHEDSDFLDPSASNPGTDDYDASADKYTNDGQLNIKTAPDADGDGNPDLVYLEPGDTLNNIGVFFFGSPDVSAITDDPVTFKAAATFDDL
jgi:hypothetical protein